MACRCLKTWMWRSIFDGGGRAIVFYLLSFYVEYGNLPLRYGFAKHEPF